MNNCTCINPGRLVRGTSTGTYAHITINMTKINETDNAQNTTLNTTQNTQAQNSAVTVVFNKL